MCHAETLSKPSGDDGAVKPGCEDVSDNESSRLLEHEEGVMNG